MGWIVPHAVSGGAREHMVRVTGPATTALLGRKNYQGFAGFWPAVADDENADPRRPRVLAVAQRRREGGLLHHPGAGGVGQRPHRHRRPGRHRQALREQDGGDIIVLASSSVIRQLLDADELDRLSITLCPELVGGGTRLFDDGPATGSWRLVDTTTTESGALCLLYDRARQ